MKKIALIALLVLSTCVNTSAFSGKMPLRLDCQADKDDTVGLRLCMELRDAIAASPRFEEWKSGTYFGLRIVSVHINANASAQAFTITMSDDEGHEYFVNSSVLVTPVTQVKDQAASILASFDQTTDKLKHRAQ